MPINQSEKSKDSIFKLMKKFLENPPTIIWGSGATIPFGMPSMGELKAKLKIKENGNLEEILSELDKGKLNECRKNIFSIMNKKDLKLRKKINHQTFETLKKMIDVFYTPHPQKVNIITTNYDCVLEYCLSYHNYPFSDGFSGREFSVFDESKFKSSKHINLLKVHGSLRWLKVDDEIRYSNTNTNTDMQAIILPTKNKYRESLREPFRTLIQKSDTIIQESKSFLVIGFGFNDEHLTPKIKSMVSNNATPILVVTKQATDACRKQLTDAKKYVIVTKDRKGTLVSYPDDKREEQGDTILEDNYWELDNFVEILCN